MYDSAAVRSLVAEAGDERTVIRIAEQIELRRADAVRRERMRWRLADAAVMRSLS